jgi:Zn-finger nucleic acid-binding protein
MRVKTLGAIELDECPTCKGTWFDKDELRKAKDAVDADLSWMDFDIWKHEDKFGSAASECICPVCNEPLVTVDYGHTSVSIGYCKACRGTWLDKDEFGKIVVALEEELIRKPFSDYVKEAVKEGVEVVTGPESLLHEWKDFMTVLRLMEYRLFIEKPSLLNAVTSVQKTVQ